MSARLKARRYGTIAPKSLMLLSVAVLIVLVSVLPLSGCSRSGDVSGDVPTPRLIALGDLIVNPADLPYVTNEGLPFYRFTDVSKYHDFQEGMKNPWLIEGSDLEKWMWLIKGRDVDLNKVTGLLSVALTDVTERTAFGYDAIRFDELSQADIDAHINYLVRQQKERFKLYITNDILIVLRTVDYPEGLRVLSRWLEGRFELRETPIELVTRSRDLVTHIDTEITHDFETLTYPPKCLAKEDCDSSFVDYTCLKCPDGKFVFHNLTCQVKPAITRTDSDQGLCWQTQNLYVSDGFYTGECISTMFCLISFEGQEVPTIHLEETRRFLPLWKEKLLEQSGASEEYYKNHFYVHSTWVVQQGDDTVFLVKYFFKVDWVTLMETTAARIREGKEGPYLEGARIKDGFAFDLNHPIERIVARNEVQASLERSCVGGMQFDESNVRITQSDRLELEAWAELDVQANKCKRATLDLESGEILACEDWACAIP
jgi:hypothetical protein